MDFQGADKTKNAEPKPSIVMGQATSGDFQTTYGERFPCWGKPDYHHFKHKEFRVTSDKLPFHADTTYRKSYDGKEVKDSQTKSVWGGLEFM